MFTKSQYIVARLMSLGNLSNSKAAIFDAGYDYEPIYRQALDQTMRIVIPHKIRREGEMVGFDSHFRPTCVREYSYCYDSFDEKYQTP